MVSTESICSIANINKVKLRSNYGGISKSTRPRSDPESSPCNTDDNNEYTKVYQGCSFTRVKSEYSILNSVKQMIKAHTSALTINNKDLSSLPQLTLRNMRD